MLWAARMMRLLRGDSKLSHHQNMCCLASTFRQSSAGHPSPSPFHRLQVRAHLIDQHLFTPEALDVGLPAYVAARLAWRERNREYEDLRGRLHDAGMRQLAASDELQAARDIRQEALLHLGAAYDAVPDPVPGNTQEVAAARQQYHDALDTTIAATGAMLAAKAALQQAAAVCRSAARQFAATWYQHEPVSTNHASFVTGSCPASCILLLLHP